MSRNLVTVKTKHGHIRVPADQVPKDKPKTPEAPEPEPEPEPVERDDDVPG